jgi:hypothetical protein
LVLSGSACLIDVRPTGPGWICNEGQCACADGLADCDGDPDTGCEIDVAKDPDHCGACYQGCSNGSCDAGQCTCAEPFWDCDGDATTGCEADVRIDRRHCGQCGGDCKGGNCREGVCQPAALVDGASLTGLSLTTTHACWLDSNELRCWPLGGAPYDWRDMDHDPGCLTTAEGQVFWISGRQLKRALPGEPTASAIVETPPGEGEGDCSIAVTPTDIFWVHSDRGELFRVSRLGGEPISIAGGVRHVTADDDHVYWSDESQTVSRLPTVGQQEPIFAAEADREIASLAVDGDHLYYSLSIGNGGDGVIMRPKAALDEPDYLYQAGDCRADLLTPGDGGLYFACTAGLRAGEVVHVSIEQRELAVVASGQVGVGGMVSSPGYLYWVTLKQLLRLAR